MLEDVIVNNLDVVFCGTAKGKTSYEKGYYYAGSGNKFYRVLYEAEFTPEKLKPSDCYSPALVRCNTISFHYFVPAWSRIR